MAELVERQQTDLAVGDTAELSPEMSLKYGCPTGPWQVLAVKPAPDQRAKKSAPRIRLWVEASCDGETWSWPAEELTKARNTCRLCGAAWANDHCSNELCEDGREGA